MKDRYDKMTDEEFDSILEELLIRDASTRNAAAGWYAASPEACCAESSGATGATTPT